jgi:hypothetical protein
MDFFEKVNIAYYIIDCKKVMNVIPVEAGIHCPSSSLRRQGSRNIWMKIFHFTGFLLAQE